VVFEGLVDTLHGTLDADTPLTWPRVMQRMFDAAGRSENVEVRRFAAKLAQRSARSRTLPAPTDEETLGELMTCLYEGLCDELGPVAADRQLNAAVAETRQLPEARAFPPDLLL